MCKYLTFVVPCYNSQAYMERCIDSLLIGGEDVEIIIVDDGSTDQTGVIADQYEKQYPRIIRVIHKENGGHGSGVNAGLKAAKGIYYKVVDSDDWLEEHAYKEVLSKVKFYCSKDLHTAPDLLVCNYVYNHLEQGITNAINYRNVFPKRKLYTWKDIGHFRPSQYLVMHALIFRTDILREAKVVLPEHTFYVDNLFSYKPLPYVKSIAYIDVDLYQYYLGRDDQSVNEKVLMKRIDQQIKVTKIVAASVDLDEVKKKYPKLAVYMCRNVSVMMAISDIHLLLIGDKEALEKKKKLWNDIKHQNAKLYYQLKYTKLSGFTDLPGKIGGQLTLGGYRLAQKMYQFQ